LWKELLDKKGDEAAIMAEPAKWIKITTTMFEDDKIDMIQKMPEGDALLIIWIRLITMAGKSNAEGYILLQEDIAYTDDMLATKFNKPLNVVRLALVTFEKFKMIQINEKGILVTNFNKHQDLDKLNTKREQDRLRQQRKREREKLLLKAAKEEIGAEENMSRVTSRDNHTKNICDNERDSSISTSTTLISIDDIEIDNSNSINHANKISFIDFFNENFSHLITPIEVQILQSYIEDGIEEAAVVLALQEAVEASRKDMRYIKKILDRWLEDGIFTVAAVIADKRNFENRKKKGGQKDGSTGQDTGASSRYNFR
jgi:DnaD and phage-associated domain/phage replisome organizer, putative, N-terminal region